MRLFLPHSDNLEAISLFVTSHNTPRYVSAEFEELLACVQPPLP